MLHRIVRVLLCSVRVPYMCPCGPRCMGLSRSDAAGCFAVWKVRVAWEIGDGSVQS